VAKLSDDRLDKFRPQRRNSNKHTQRGSGMLEASMRQYGYVAPMTAAADGEIIDGSARIETSATVFGDDVLVVHHDGTKPVIMVRDDIPSADTPEARAISVAANRIAQVNLDYDAEVILADLAAGVDLSSMFRQDELDEIIAGLNGEYKLDTGFEPEESASKGLKEVTFVLPDEHMRLVESVLDEFVAKAPAEIEHKRSGALFALAQHYAKA